MNDRGGWRRRSGRGGAGGAPPGGRRGWRAKIAPIATLLLAALAAVGGGGGPSASALAQAPPRPNLLLITADDLNADSAGWMGSPLALTPRLDALAGSAHRFVNAHVTAPICQPSRSALFTGRVPHRSGALGFDPVGGDVPTLVEVLRAQGYHTAAINKLAHMQPASKFPWDLALTGSGRRPRALGAAVARCFAAARDAGRPFFLNVNITDPHRPFRNDAGAADARPSPPRGVGLQQATVPVPGFLEDLPPVRGELARYYASVARFDASLGEVLDAVAGAGHAHDTVIVFLSDNGASFPFAKGSVYRNGTWAPVLLRHPGMAPAATHDELVSSVDLMPTLLEVMDVPPPAGMDGRSWGPLLRGETQNGRNVVVTHVNTVRSGARYPQRCARTRTGALLFQPWADGQTTFWVEAMRGRAFRAIAQAARHDPRIDARVRQLVAGVPLAFYDLARDPDERRNLIDDPAHRPEIERLQDRLLAHMERTGDPEVARFRRAVADWRAAAR